jgi:hypothetical protein
MMMPELQGDKECGTIYGDSPTTRRTVSHRVQTLSLAYPLDTSNNSTLVDLQYNGTHLCRAKCRPIRECAIKVCMRDTGLYC